MTTSEMEHPEQERSPGRGIAPWQVAVLAVAVGAAFVTAFLLTRDRAEEPAATEEPAPAAGAALDPAPPYDVVVSTEPDPPVIEGTTVAVLVTLDGEPVSVDGVRLGVEMTEHAHDGLRLALAEVEPGRYETDTTFMMRGLWEGGLTISTEGAEDVTVPVSWMVE